MSDTGNEATYRIEIAWSSQDEAYAAKVFGIGEEYFATVKLRKTFEEARDAALDWIRRENEAPRATHTYYADDEGQLIPVVVPVPQSLRA